jgi:hypothetical protein
MSTQEGWTNFEQVGVVLGLLLLAIGTAEITELIEILPVHVYVIILWILTAAMWIYRR